jgi:hypothetical protein
MLFFKKKIDVITETKKFSVFIRKQKKQKLNGRLKNMEIMILIK